ncbi:unnamed protein product [Zymoseptoria tritici ST99CH_3D1]|uniref:Uncharacterized protein n=1 Tax=Zymoseptoria tritici (strain CBS 115943 / IPO323) TaxID=336722 RepID=F9X4R7_ZYMTI|nr:uncharacterized protein MYCGRDRAFT_91211 [Zymoseptoria tritici IPO323]EGP90255.1 hypothetical protein MYCGRDRAFT_91211 [Zymoseptoria tritici IPO323]SMR47973.1 unnamed protein product [Zymoseptoria tritici ST99CH_3D1]
MASTPNQQLDHMMVTSSLTDRTRAPVSISLPPTDRSPRSRSASPPSPLPSEPFRRRRPRLSALIRQARLKPTQQPTTTASTPPRTPLSDISSNGIPNTPASSRRLRRVKRFEISPSADFSASATPPTSPADQAAEEGTVMPAWMEDLRACDESLENDKENLEGFVTRLFGREGGSASVEMNWAGEEVDEQTRFAPGVEGAAHSPLHRRGGSGNLRAEFVRGN